MIRKGFTHEVIFEIDFDETLVVLAMGTISIAGDRFWSGPLYERRGNLEGC